MRIPATSDEVKRLAREELEARLEYTAARNMVADIRARVLRPAEDELVAARARWSRKELELAAAIESDPGSARNESAR